MEGYTLGHLNLFQNQVISVLLDFISFIFLYLLDFEPIGQNFVYLYI